MKLYWKLLSLFCVFILHYVHMQAQGLAPAIPNANTSRFGRSGTDFASTATVMPSSFATSVSVIAVNTNYFTVRLNLGILTNVGYHDMVDENNRPIGQLTTSSTDGDIDNYSNYSISPPESAPSGYTLQGTQYVNSAGRRIQYYRIPRLVYGSSSNLVTGISWRYHGHLTRTSPANITDFVGHYITAEAAVNANQASVSISPSSRTVTAGTAITFTASGGSGTGAYTWGGEGAGTGSSKTITFNTVGTYNVTVYRAASTGYNASNTASASITVTPAEQATVSITPISQTVAVGSTISFSASGGSGTGAYRWGGDASGTGTSKSVTFGSAGTRTVTVYRAASTNYNESNLATATINVVSAPPSLTLTVSSQSKIFPEDIITLNVNALISFGTIAYYDWRVVSPNTTSAYSRHNGPSNPLSGVHQYTVTSIGQHRFDVTATSSLGETATASVLFTSEQGKFNLPVTAQALPATNQTIWFTPSQTTTTSVPVEKVR